MSDSTTPSGWVSAPVLDVVQLLDSQRIPLNKSQRSARQGTYSYYGANGLVDHIDGYLFEGNHILLAEDGGFFDDPNRDVAYQVDGRFWVNNHAHILKALGDIPDRFLCSYLNSIYWMPYVSGTTRLKLTQAGLRRVEIPLPPLPEQKRIVAKLGKLTTRSTRARAELDRIPRLVARYKQAVLAAAFRGDLTADWREANKRIMDGQKQAHAIEQARQRLADNSSARKPSKRASSQKGVRIPVALGDLPGSWAQLTLEKVTSPLRLIQYGILMPGPDIEDGVPYVKVLNIKNGIVELDKIRRTTEEIHNSYRRSALTKGDILLTIRGTVGRLAFVREEIVGGNITQDSVRIDVLLEMNSRFVYWFLHSPAAQVYFQYNQKGVAVRGINVGDVRPMEVPIPSLHEQGEIVCRLDRAFATIDRFAAEHNQAAALLDRLDQSILAKAFRGELVPQDPNEEPASMLLERIRAERAAAPKSKRGRRKAKAS